MKRWPWVLPVAFVVGVLFWHGVFRSPWSESQPQPPSAADEPADSADVSAADLSEAEASLDESAFMTDLRSLEAADPAHALALAREGNRRFPPGGDAAAERGAIIALALARLGRISEARGEAERLAHDYPDTHWALEVEAQTRAQPPRKQ